MTQRGNSHEVRKQPDLRDECELSRRGRDVRFSASLATEHREYEIFRWLRVFAACYLWATLPVAQPNRVSAMPISQCQEVNESGDLRLDPASFVLIIEWQGAKTKPVPELGLASEANQKRLTDWVERWREQDKVFHAPKRRTRILTAEEISALEALFRTDTCVKLLCTEKQGTGRQGYAVKLSAASGDRLYEIGSEGEALKVIAGIRDCLGESSQETLVDMISYLRRIMKAAGNRS